MVTGEPCLLLVLEGIITGVPVGLHYTGEPISRPPFLPGKMIKMVTTTVGTPSNDRANPKNYEKYRRSSYSAHPEVANFSVMFLFSKA